MCILVLIFKVIDLNREKENNFNVENQDKGIDVGEKNVGIVLFKLVGILSIVNELNFLLKVIDLDKKIDSNIMNLNANISVVVDLGNF